ncbi:MAG: FtsQ-type POTRA domain-containing protein [Proteobacteria bacterium]|nr:FtsQ-type POTRA domain-containing protein [Pseudomonadota bacterium]
MRAPARTPRSSGRSSGATPARRDYDRRKKRSTSRKSGKPVWRQPMLLGLAVLLLGMGGGGGWLAWREGWLVAIQTHVEDASRAVVAAVTPFKLADITVEGRDYVTREAILAALDVKAGDSLLGIDLQAARHRLEAIDWVASATVERRLPDTLYVTLRERRAVAIWQNGTEYTLIDQNGRTVRASRMPPGAESLLLLGGPGAPEHVGDLLLLLTYEPKVTKQLRAAVWVGQRRWNLVLKNDVEIWLPEEDAVAALQRLGKLDDEYKLLSREFGVIDLRLPDKLYLRKRGSAEDAPSPSAAAKPVQSKV